MLKKIAYGILVIISILLIWNYELVIYGISQAKGQLTLIWKARDVDQVLQDNQVPDSLKTGIRLVQEIKEFAIDSVGVNATKNYSTFYDQHGKEIMWVVTACEPFELKNKEWSFPFLGTFSYKGYFNEEWALNLKEELTGEGYDTGIRNPSAWSTLGFFKDPILSNFLNRDPGDLANTIIHELTHATIFVKDSLQFNENIATFFGDRGAEKFLIFKYGKDSQEYENYMNDQYDDALFTQHILQGTDQLDSLYKSFTPELEESLKYEKKTNLIRQIITTVDTLSLKNKERYTRYVSHYTKPENLPNNTYFMSFRRYQANIKGLQNQYENNFNGNLKGFLHHLKEKNKSL